MSAGNHEPVCRLIALGKGSLLQYVSESVPWSKPGAASALEKIVALANEERDEVARLTRWLQKKHVKSPSFGSYPSHFTTMNFVTVDYLLPKLIAENTRELADIERIAASADEDEDHQLVQAYQEMKRRHLQSLQDLTASKAPAAIQS